jgi:hypothetical protein
MAEVTTYKNSESTSKAGGLKTAATNSTGPALRCRIILQEADPSLRPAPRGCKSGMPRSLLLSSGFCGVLLYGVEQLVEVV